MPAAALLAGPSPTVSQPPQLLIRGGRVIDPVSGLDRVADVAIKDGMVAGIGARLSAPTKGEGHVIDARGLIVAPGLIDPHVHLREPGHEERETIATGSAAAAMGGFTTICCMPNTSPALDTAVMIEYVKARAALGGSAADGESAQGARCRVFAAGAATKGRAGEELSEIALMAKAGAVGFSDDGDAIASAGMMSKALAAVRPTGLAFMQHCQDPTMTRGASMNAGPVATRLGLIGWPRAAEEVIIERDLRLNRSVGARYHVQHISSAGSVDLVRRARAEDGLSDFVTAEAAPHHLLLTDAECEGYNTNAKMNPPLRGAADVAAIREAIAEGVITVLATDHAPHSPESKEADFASASFGIVGLETALALYVRALLDTGFVQGWPRLLELLTINPARLCNLDRLGLGQLALGGPADVTLIDPDLEWTIDPGRFAGKGRNTPFAGWKVRARAVGVIVAGRVMFALPETVG